MSDSMKRIAEGDYYIQLGHDEYRVIKETYRVSTGRTQNGKVETIWRAYRGDFLLAECDKYSRAKEIVFEDYRTPEDKRPGPSRSLRDPERCGEGAVQPSLWEDSSDEDDDEPETAIGGRTVMEQEHEDRYSFSN